MWARYTGAVQLRYVECPRDAWQGLARVIPTPRKIAFVQALLDAGFRQLDVGSFVSPKAVPQLADTEAVLSALAVPEGAELLAIVANRKGLARALAAPKLTHIGFPLSVNATFQQRNANQSLEAAWQFAAELVAEARAAGLTLVVYLSMGFGNPYGEPWQPADTAQAVARLRALGVSEIALADTAGSATPERLQAVLAATEAPERLGLHLHARPDDWQGKLEVALAHGIRWFEGALSGAGGCPFAADALVGNLPTEQVLPYLAARGLPYPVAGLEVLACQAAELAREHA